MHGQGSQIDVSTSEPPAKRFRLLNRHLEEKWKATLKKKDEAPGKGEIDI